jgi:hypothetical protein
MDAKAYSRAFDILYRQKKAKVRTIALSLTGTILAVLGFVESGTGAHATAFGSQLEIFPLLVKIFAGALSFGIGWGLASIFWFRHVTTLTRRNVEIWKSTTGGNLSGSLGGEYLEAQYRGGFQRLPLCAFKNVLVDGATLIVDFGDQLGMLVFVVPNTSDVHDVLRNAKANPPMDDGEFLLTSETMGRAFRVLYRHNLRAIRTVSVYSLASITATCAFLFTGNEAIRSDSWSFTLLLVKVLSGIVSFGAMWALLTFAWGLLVNRYAVRAISRWESVTGGKAIGKIDGEDFEIQGSQSANRYPLVHMKNVLTDKDILIVEMNELWGGRFFYLPNTPAFLKSLQEAGKRANEPLVQPMAAS